MGQCPEARQYSRLSHSGAHDGVTANRDLYIEVTAKHNSVQKYSLSNCEAEVHLLPDLAPTDILNTEQKQHTPK
jgi:hypothetical protein